MIGPELQLTKCLGFRVTEVLCVIDPGPCNVYERLVGGQTDGRRQRWYDWPPVDMVTYTRVDV